MLLQSFFNLAKVTNKQAKYLKVLRMKTVKLKDI